MTIIRILTLAVSLITMLPVSARADDYAKGMDAYFAGKYTTAFKLIKPAADAGNFLAEYQLGLMYDFGQGIRENNAEALDWYRKAANKNDPRAEVALAQRLMDGRDIARDQAGAISWYRKAAAQGQLTALLRLAVAYRDGQGVPKDVVLAHVFASKQIGKMDLIERRKLSLAMSLTAEQRAESNAFQDAWVWPQHDELPAASKTGQK